MLVTLLSGEEVWYISCQMSDKYKSDLNVAQNLKHTVAHGRSQHIQLDTSMEGVLQYNLYDTSFIYLFKIIYIFLSFNISIR